MCALETVDFDGGGVELKTIVASQELLESAALVSLKLDDLAHLRVRNYGAIAGKLLLDDLENLEAGIISALLEEENVSREGQLTFLRENFEGMP